MDAWRCPVRVELAGVDAFSGLELVHPVEGLGGARRGRWAVLGQEWAGKALDGSEDILGAVVALVLGVGLAELVKTLVRHVLAEVIEGINLGLLHRYYTGSAKNTRFSQCFSHENTRYCNSVTG
jgi:hypothetical protein